MQPKLFLLFTSVYAKNDWSADIDRGKPQPEKVLDFLFIMFSHFYWDIKLIEYNCIYTFKQINLRKDFDILGVNRTSIYHSLALEVRPRALECFSFYATENYHTDIELENSVTDQFHGLIRDKEGNVVETLNSDYKHMSGRVVLKNTTEVWEFIKKFGIRKTIIRVTLTYVCLSEASRNLLKWKFFSCKCLRPKKIISLRKIVSEILK